MSRGLVLALVAAGCSSEAGIEVCFESACDGESCGDTLAISVALSRDAAAFCEPVTITTTPVLPYCLAISPGERYGDGVAVRADLLSAGAIRARREVAFDFRADTIVHHDVGLDVSCFAADPCPDDAQCTGGACSPLPFGPLVFDGDQSAVVAGDACEASTG